MTTEEAYKEGYYRQDILKGLKFHFDLFSGIYPDLFNNPQSPIHAREIITAIGSLEAIPMDHKVNRLRVSQPMLTMAIKNVYYPNLEKEIGKALVISFLGHLLDAANSVLFNFSYLEIAINSADYSEKDKLKYLVNLKYHFQQHGSAYTTGHAKRIVEFIDSEISRLKELIDVERGNVSDLHDLLRKHLETINIIVRDNDLITPLKEKNYDAFIERLERTLYVPSYHDLTEDDKEKMFHIYLLGVLQGLFTPHYTLKSNKESGVGRYDITLSPLDKFNDGVIIEIKKVDSQFGNIETELNGALNQIKEKVYNFELRAEGVQDILNIAIIFQGFKPHIKFELDKKVV